jgi:hypothetical protein
MNKQDVQFLLDAKIGSRLILRGIPHIIVGKFHDKYIHENGCADAYILSLDGHEEVGVEERVGDWYVWASRYVETCQKSELDRMGRRMNVLEKGRVETPYKEGIMSTYDNYWFGTKMNKGIFLGISENDFDVWLNTPIELKNVRIE